MKVYKCTNNYKKIIILSALIISFASIKTYAINQNYSPMVIVASDKYSEDEMKKFENMTVDAPETIDGYKNTRGIYPTAQLQNFPEMRAAIDKIFGISTAYNKKYGGFYETSEGNFQNPSYHQVVSSNDIWATGKLGTKEVQDALKQAAKLSFKDIKGTEWYASKVALMTYFGVVGGKTDKAGNTIFDANSAVTRAEFNTMLFKWRAPSSTVYTVQWHDGTTTNEKKIGGNTWYGPYVMAQENDNFIGILDGLNKDMLAKPMTRLECTWLIMNRMYIDETQQAIDQANAGKAFKSTFVDTKKVRDVYKELKLIVNDPDVGTYIKDGADLKALNEMLAHPEKGIDIRVLNVLELAKQKGIIGGTSDNKVLWNKAVTRAEALQMLHNVDVEMCIANGGHAVK